MHSPLEEMDDDIIGLAEDGNTNEDMEEELKDADARTMMMKMMGMMTDVQKEVENMKRDMAQNLTEFKEINRCRRGQLVSWGLLGTSAVM